MYKPKSTYSESDKSPNTIDDGKSNKAQEFCMLKKFVSMLALVGLFSAPAMALTDPGFEAGTAGWDANTINGSVTRMTSGVFTVFDDRSGDFNTGYNVDPVSGSAYGLLVSDYAAGPTQMRSFNLSGTPTVAGDSMFFRLFSAETDLAHNNDYFTVTYNNVLGQTSSMTWHVSDTYAALGVNPATQVAPDSGWIEFAPLVGTTSVAVKLYDVSADGLTPPMVAVDFVAAPVPEADASAMMVVGLGVLGLLARRRRIAKSA